MLSGARVLPCSDSDPCPPAGARPGGRYGRPHSCNNDAAAPTYLGLLLAARARISWEQQLGIPCKRRTPR